MSEQKKATSAREIRARSTYSFDVDPTLTVKMRRLDMTTLILQNLVPLHLLKAAQEFEEMAEQINSGIKTGNTVDATKAAMDRVDPEKLREMNEFMQRYACAMVAEPIVVMEDDGNPDHLPVQSLTGEQLVAITYARPPEEQPVITTEQAETFRMGQTRPRPDGDDVQAGESVRPESKLVDFPDRDAISA